MRRWANKGDTQVGIWAKIAGHFKETRDDVPEELTKSKSRSHPPVGGAIQHYGLEDWWFNELNQSQRELIQRTYQPLGRADTFSPLLEGETISSQTTALWLATLAGWFKAYEADQAELILQIADKAWALKEQTTPAIGPDAIFSKHLALGALSKIYYRFRDNPECLKRALEAAHMQVAMQAEAMDAWIEKQEHLARVTGTRDHPIVFPSHAGYKRLAIVLEKEKRYEEALELVKEAKENCWYGDWDKRIERIRKKMSS